MKSNIKIIIMVALLVLVVAGAVIGYSLFKDDVNNTTTQADTKTQKTVKITDFNFFDINNNEVKLSSFSGKPIVLNFWATWCPSCVSELPDFQSAYNTYKDDIQFIMLNLTDGDRETEKSVKDFISENKYTFPVYMDKKAEGRNAYGIYSIPQTMFIDKEGNIIYTYTGGITLHDLETYIKQISE